MIGMAQIAGRAQHGSMTVLRSTAFLAAVSFVSVSARADDAWPTFRGPDGNGIAAEGPVVIQWSPSNNVRWRTELPGEGWSSPVVGEDRAFLTAAIPVEGQENEYRLCLLIVDVNNGRLIKTVDVMRQSPERPARIHSKNSHASPTPILDGNHVFVHFGYQGTACVTRSGEIVWVNRDLFFKPTHGNGGSPILVDGRLVFTCDGDKNPRVVALDAKSGELLWETPRTVSAKKTFSFCTPTVIEVNGRKQVIAPGSDCVLAIDPANGSVIWDVRYEGYSVVPKPVFHRGLVYVSTSFDSPEILAIDPTGRGVVTDTNVVWRVARNGPKTPSMLAHDGLVYSVSDDGIALCMDASTGEIIYRKRIGGKFSASPLLAGGNLYFTSEEGVTTVARAGIDYEEVAENDLEERTLASLAVINGDLLIRTAEALYRIGD